MDQMYWRQQIKPETKTTPIIKTIKEIFLETLYVSNKSFSTPYLKRSSCEIFFDRGFVFIKLY